MNTNRKGYKQTALGWIPKEWEVKTIKDVFQIVPTATYSRIEEVRGGKLLYIHYGDIHTKYDFHLSLKNPSIPTLDISKKKNYQLLELGDLIVADASEDYDGVGKAVEVTELAKEEAIAGLHTILLKEKGTNFSLGFKGYVTTNDCVRVQFYRLATGTKVYSISKASIETIQLPLPPLPEQKAIADCLSTWDRAIAIQTELVKAKEQRKKALMQQLLTGKKRLPGFKEKWKIRPLSYFFKNVVREVPKPDYPYLGIGIRSHGKGTFLKYDEQPESNSMDSFYVVRKNDLIVNITFAWEQAIAIVKPEDDGALASHRFPTYTLEDTADPLFFKFIIVQPFMKYKLELISPGGAGRNRVMNRADFLKMEFELPKHEEQTAIAAVLETADKEIALEGKKLQALQQQKKGLMQVLLTGNVRIKPAT